MSVPTSHTRSLAQRLSSIWVPLVVGIAMLALLGLTGGLVWQDYRTALMESQTRQLELVVQSLADSIEFSLDEYTDRLDSAARKVSEEHNLRPGLARSGISGSKTARETSLTAATALRPAATCCSPAPTPSPTGSTTEEITTIWC